MVKRKTWEEFRSTGLIWLINSILHTFGWSIVLTIDKDKIIDVYPTRVKFRGFSKSINIEGYQKISKYINKEHEDLLKESLE